MIKQTEIKTMWGGSIKSYRYVIDFNYYNIDNSSNGHYRLWNDGFCEVFGYGNTDTAKMPVKYRTIGYKTVINPTPTSNATKNIVVNIVSNSVTVNSFKVQRMYADGTSSNQSYYFTTTGFVDINDYLV